MSSPSMPRRVAYLASGLVAGHVLLAWQVRARGIFMFGDDASYLLLARSLRQFSYREVQYIGEPIAARFPPGYPALLAITGLAGESLAWFSLVGIVLYASGLVALFDVVRRRWTPEIGLLVAAVAAVYPSGIVNAGAIASEGPFTALTLWSLWAADRYEAGERPAWLACAGSILTALVRSAGVTLPLALGVHWVVRRRYRLVVALALATSVTVGAWLAWTVLAPKREVRRSYVEDAVAVRSGTGTLASTLVTRMRRNVVTYVGQIVPDELKLPVLPQTRADNIAWVVVIGVLGVAGLASMWGRWNAAFWFVASYAGLLAVWPYTLERFLQPLMPLLIAGLIVGAWAIARGLGGRTRLALPVVLTVFLAGRALLADEQQVARATDCDRAYVDCAPPSGLDFVDAAEYIRTNTPRTARLVTPKNATLYYYAQRQSVFWDEAVAQDSAQFLPYLARNDVRYVLVTPVFTEYQRLLRLSRANCRRLDVARSFSAQTFVLVRRDDDAATTRACEAVDRATRATARLGTLH